MTTLSLCLLPGALSRFQDALVCLAKNGETVGIEAEYDLVCGVQWNVPEAVLFLTLGSFA